MGIIDLKTVIDLLKESGKIEEIKKVRDAQNKIEELTEEKRILNNELNNCREDLKIKNSITFEHNAYWIMKEPGGKIGPYCSCCYDSDKKLIIMHECVNPRYSECPKCKNRYKVKRK